MKDVLIIGAGISGMAAGFYLQKGGLSVDILEKQEGYGGVIQSYQENGFLAERGPHTLQINSPQVEEFVNDLNLTTALYAPPNAQRYIVRDCQIQGLPMRPSEFLNTKALSFEGKLRALLELFLPKTYPKHSSVGNFFEARFGKEFVNYFVDPFISGIYAGSVHNLSLEYAFPKVYDIANKNRSLLWYLMKQGVKAPPKVLSFENGMQELIQGLAKTLDASLKKGVSFRRLHLDYDGVWCVDYETKGQRQYQEYKHIVLALPAHNLPSLPFVNQLLQNNLSQLSQLVTYTSIGCLTLGISKSDLLQTLNGFGFLVPSCEPFSILGTLFTSSVFANRAPEGYCTLATFLGGVRFPSLAQQPQKVLERFVLDTLSCLKIIKPGTKTAFSHYSKWEKAIPQYTTTHSHNTIEKVAHIQKIYPTLHLLGDYYQGLSLGACIQKAKNLASTIC